MSEATSPLSKYDIAISAYEFRLTRRKSSNIIYLGTGVLLGGVCAYFGPQITSLSDFSTDGPILKVLDIIPFLIVGSLLAVGFWPFFRSKTYLFSRDLGQWFVNGCTCGALADVEKVVAKCPPRVNGSGYLPPRFDELWFYTKNYQEAPIDKWLSVRNETLSIGFQLSAFLNVPFEEVAK